MEPWQKERDTRQSSRRRHRTGCMSPTSPTCAWRTDASATRRSSPTRSPAASSAERAPPAWTPRSCRCRRWSRRPPEPRRTAGPTGSCTIPTMACSTPAPSTPAGSRNTACCPRRHAQRLADLLLGDAVTYEPFAQSGAAFDQRCTSK